MTAEPPEAGRPSADRTSAPDDRTSAGVLLRGGAPGRWFGNVLRRAAAWPIVRGLKSVLDVYAAAGGGLLAASLAFGAVFAAIPTVLLVLGVAGLFVADPEVRAGAARELAGRVPPLQGSVGRVRDELAAGAGGVSLLGLAGLAWSAGRFFGGPGRRGFLDRTVRGGVRRVSPGGCRSGGRSVPWQRVAARS